MARAPEPSPSQNAREVVLARVRAALAGADAAGETLRTYRQLGTAEVEERAALFCARVADYRAEVRRVEAEALPAAIAAVFAARAARRVCVPAGVPAAWRPAGLELVEDHRLSARELDACDGVLTGSTLAIAETGTVVLSAAASEGRRLLTLVPDLHVCVVDASAIVETVPEALRLLAPLVRSERRPLTLISGPSATSDIELSRIEGVHGPRSLVVLVASPSA
jgi:L-lactate dehydrogenase complex protein LldG